MKHKKEGQVGRGGSVPEGADVLELNREAWDAIAESTPSPYIKHPIYLKMFNLFCGKLEKGARVLDLGCGPGVPITKELIKRGFIVTAVDISEAMIKQAKSNVPEAKYVHSSMTDITFKDRFDGIFAGYAMLCLDPENFRKTAVRIHEALKQGGFFLLALNEPHAGHSQSENYTNILGHEMYNRPYTEKEIRDAFEPLGMKVLRVERERVISEVFGTEHCLLVLMQKE